MKDLLDGIVSDGGPNVVCARRKLSRNDTCFLHTTDLPLREGLEEPRYKAVLEKMDKIVGLSHRSDKVIAALKHAQTVNGVKVPVGFPKPSQTR